MIYTVVFDKSSPFVCLCCQHLAYLHIVFFYQVLSRRIVEAASLTIRPLHRQILVSHVHVPLLQCYFCCVST